MFGDVLTDSVAARVQSEVAKFLSLKQTLLSLVNNSNLTVANRATRLYSQQTLLEDQLPGVLQVITNIQAGAYNISDIARVGIFANAMEQQIKDVNALGKGQTSTLPVSMPILLAGSLTIAGLAILYYRR